MHRIDTDTRDIDEHGAGKDGFTEGDPGQGVAPTDFSADWCDAVQEEIANVIESTGTALDKNDNTQLQAAIETRVDTYNGARTRNVLVDPLVARPVSAGDWTVQVPGSDYDFTWESGADGGRIVVPLNEILRTGVGLNAVQALVKPGAARGAGNRVSITFYIATVDFDGPTYVSLATAELPGSVSEDDGTTNEQVIGLVVDGPVDRENERLFAVIQAGADAGTNKDQILALMVEFDDPGPRNH